MTDHGRALSRRTATLGVLAAVAGGVSVASARVRAEPAAGSDPAGEPADGATASGGRAAAPAATGADDAATRPASPAAARNGGRGASSGSRSELPRGGRSLFPRYRVVAYAGLPGTPALGRLGIGDLQARTAELEALARRYTGDGRQPLPALELITVVAQTRPGQDGLYRERIEPAIIDAHLAAARRRRALLLLDIQPGRARFLDEVRAHERWLREPDVGVALDPEWAVRGGHRPGQVFGHVLGHELDAVSAWLARLAAAHDLPEKLMVVHVLTPSVLRDVGALRRRSGVSVVRSVDGIGTPAAKRRTWRGLLAAEAAAMPVGWPPVMSGGFKLFYVEDARGGSRVMTPAEVLALRPVPDYVCYE